MIRLKQLEIDLTLDPYPREEGLKFDDLFPYFLNVPPHYRLATIDDFYEEKEVGYGKIKVLKETKYLIKNKSVRNKFPDTFYFISDYFLP